MQKLACVYYCLHHPVCNHNTNYGEHHHFIAMLLNIGINHTLILGTCQVAILTPEIRLATVVYGETDTEIHLNVHHSSVTSFTIHT